MIEFRSDAFIMPRENELLAMLDLETGGKVQCAIDNAVIAYCEPYTPWDTGNLAASPRAATVIGSGEIVYPGPYAHYQYYGEVYGPNIPIFDDSSSGEPTGWFSPPGQKKNPTGRALQYDTSVNPLAGSFWFEHMKADRVDDIVAEAQKVAAGRR